MKDVPLYNLGDTIYHKTSEDMGIIIGIIYRPGTMLYQVVWEGLSTEDHYECELTLEKPTIFKLHDKHDD
jgi:hypothetical protein